MDSIKGKTEIKKFEPHINNYIGYLNGYRVNCCWMDENTATYSSEYVCEIDDEKEGPFNFIGYDINQYIACQLNPIYFFDNINIPMFLRSIFYPIMNDNRMDKVKSSDIYILLNK